MNSGAQLECRGAVVPNARQRSTRYSSQRDGATVLSMASRPECVITILLPTLIWYRWDCTETRVLAAASDSTRTVNSAWNGRP